MPEPLLKDDLMFHAAHGLCRVTGITPSTGTEDRSYTLLPVTQSKARVRFTIPGPALEISGFNKLISTAEGHAIMNYFKSGQIPAGKDNHAWRTARYIREESASTDSAKDNRKRLRLEQAVRSLVRELTVVLEMTLKDVAEKIQRDLERVSKVNPFVQNAFGKVDRD